MWRLRVPHVRVTKHFLIQFAKIVGVIFGALIGLVAILIFGILFLQRAQDAIPYWSAVVLNAPVYVFAFWAIYKLRLLGEDAEAAHDLADKAVRDVGDVTERQYEVENHMIEHMTGVPVAVGVIVKAPMQYDTPPTCVTEGPVVTPPVQYDTSPLRQVATHVREAGVTVDTVPAMREAPTVVVPASDDVDRTLARFHYGNGYVRRQ